VVLEELQGSQMLRVWLGADEGGHDGGTLPVARLVDREEEDDLVAGAEGLQKGGREGGRREG